MYLFFIGLAMLAGGYFAYGKFIERILGPDDRKTPAVKNADGVDYVVLPQWKNMLIQLLNIAGVGPVIGVIIGIKFGAEVFLIIPVGNLIAGATHDFIAGMMSLRYGGANLPLLTRKTMGKTYANAFSVFMVLLLLLVVAVFINVPASLIDGNFQGHSLFWPVVGAIFAYYVAATLFPIDKIIGRIYPFFGFMLLVGTLAIFVSLMFALGENPALLDESAAFKGMKWCAANNHPAIPLLFVTIACGIISGFHATQSPIIARTMKSERQARASFYGMMVVEGFIAMIWAAAGLAIYNTFPELFDKNPNSVLLEITHYFLGSYMGAITVVAVVILAVTSGDTAMRSMRLSLAEIFGINQKPISSRLLTTLPLVLLVAVLLVWSNADKDSFAHLWNYFAWGNQVLAASTLVVGSIWLFRRGRNGLVALLPGLFMTFIVASFILWASPAHGGPVGAGLELDTAYLISGLLVFAVGIYAGVRSFGGGNGKGSRRKFGKFAKKNRNAQNADLRVQAAKQPDATKADA